MPRDHVLTKTFYLLKEFPGRFASGQLWVEATPRASDEEAETRPARAGDGVSLAHHHVERSRRRLGDAAGRPADAAADVRPSRASANSRSAPASTS